MAAKPMRIFFLMLMVAGCDAGDPGAPDLAGRDGGADLGGLPDGALPAGPVRYPAGVLHSPMSRSVVERLQAILASTPHRKDVFMKVGDSITVNTNFLNCFAGMDVKLDAFSGLEPSRQFFKQTLADATKSSFDRASLAAVVGWNTNDPLAGTPPVPLDQEIAAIDPAFAVVMMGTNDTEAIGVQNFERNLGKLVDAILAAKIVPLVSTIPPRSDPTANAVVPDMNAVVRAVAQSRQVPYLDLWQTMTPLPQLGLGGDGVHPNVYLSSGAHGCWLTADGLMFGFNQRNKITLEALDRVHRYLQNGEAPEPAPAPLTGSGTFDDPRVIDALPFVDDGDTTASKSSAANVYACGAQDESGPEIVYQVVLGAPTNLRARVFADEGADIDVHWLDAPDPTRCTARADKTFDVSAGPGTFYLVADTFVSGGVPQAGGYRLSLVQLP